MGTNRVSTLVLLFFFFSFFFSFFFNVEKCVSATNGPLKKNLSRYKRNRLFRTITDFRPVNDFFESFTPPVHLRQSLSFTTTFVVVVQQNKGEEMYILHDNMIIIIYNLEFILRAGLTLIKNFNCLSDYSTRLFRALTFAKERFYFAEDIYTPHASELIKLFTVYFLISRLELRIIYRGDDRRCLDYRFDDALSHCTTFFPANVISGLLSRPSKDIESFHRPIGKETRENCTRCYSNDTFNNSTDARMYNCCSNYSDNGAIKFHV